MPHQSDHGARLTGRERQPILSIMCRPHPISWLLRAVSLAAMGFLLSVGTAAAHDGHVSGRGQAALSSESASAVSLSGDISGFDDQSGVAAASPKQSNAAKHGGDPCSDDQSDAKHATGCCTMACHAALATLPACPLTGPDRPSLLLLGVSEILHGRSGDRMERPPKLA